MNGEAVDKIAELARLDLENQTTEINGQIYSAYKLDRVPEYCPKVATVEVTTLGGFADFINANKEGIMYEEYFVHVVNHRSVMLYSKPTGEDKGREIPVAAHVDTELEKFHFGEFIEGEMFIIKLVSLFQSTDDLERLMSYTAKVDIGEGITLSDDGVTQSAKVERSISGALTDNNKAPSMVELKPYRTFREIDQPESRFLFRMQAGRSGGVECALFEADGGAWRIDAMKRINIELVNMLPTDLDIFS